MTNKTLILKKIPTGAPIPGEHLTIEDRAIDLLTPPKGGLVFEILYASFDPYLRGKMRDASIKSYSAPFNLNEPVTNGTIAKVLNSDNDEWQVGDLAIAHLPIAEYARVEQSQLPGVRKLHNPYNLDLAHFLGALGSPGLTAYSGLYKIGQPARGEVIFISSAAGAVGQVVGQIAKHEGLRVVGSVGSDEKLRFIIDELGFDGGFNYKKEAPKDALPRLCPHGIDIYFENVGGAHLEAALDNMNVHGRIPTCGMIGDYNKEPQARYGVKNMFQIVAKQLLMKGFLVVNPEYGREYFQEHQQVVQKWLSDGSFPAKLHIIHGIDNAAEGFVGMLNGENFGKAVLKIRSSSRL